MILSTFESALLYTKAGISIIPILPTEGVRPNVSNETPFDCREYIRHRIASQRNSTSGLQTMSDLAWQLCSAPSAAGLNVWI